MKSFSKSLLLIVFLLGMCLPSWGQASTQGKEFWVSSSIVCSPGKDKGIIPYIAVSAEKACVVKIQGGLNNAINITQTVAAGSWNEFGNANKAYNTDATKGLINVQMDAASWYPINTKEPATVCNLAGQKNMYGLHITATENISVYVILGGPSSMDASNILPLTALGAEYYVQDYFPEAHNSDSWGTNAGNMISMVTILGTEDGTKVDITPKGRTYDGHADGVTYTIELNKGQTYYLMSEKEKQLAGTHIQAQNDRKVAIYTGLPLTRLPNGVSARDAMFEQPMPVEYWGTQFIATRSLGKNGNLIGITASMDGTEIKLDGYTQAYIQSGETYYLMLQNAGDPQANKPGTSSIDQSLIGDVVFIETSCPCAVYSYDTGNGYVGKGKDDSGTVINEIDNSKGDPSSVWVSPIQQKIGKITFGTCYTNNTKDHFLNVVTETSTCQSTTLTALYGATTLDKTNMLNWQPVPGNPTYSYARAQIGDASTEKYSVFRLENPKGFIANIYGNGDDESYAYSAGSAAVEQGVNVNGVTFTNGYVSDDHFCKDDELQFDAKVGTDEITRVDWDFGDGTTMANGEPKTTHSYNVAGWYDVKASLFGHQVCTDESEMPLGTVQFSFRVMESDTVYGKPELVCLDPDQVATIERQYNQTVPFTAYDTVPAEDCTNPVTIRIKEFALNTSYEYSHEDYDSCYLNGNWYYTTQDVPWYAGKNSHGCDSTVTCHLRIRTCLDVDIPNNIKTQHVCPGEPFDLPYRIIKGEMGETRYICGNSNVVVDPDDVSHTISLPTENMAPGAYKARITIQDDICNRTLEFPIDLQVFYPSSIFKYKFNNVLAVYNKDYNGGYEFTGYQWYRNGEAIPGANESVYHTEEPFVLGDTYFVVLTRADGVTLPSCEQTINSVPNYDATTGVPAQKKLINNRMYIYIENRIYDSHGQRIK